MSTVQLSIIRRVTDPELKLHVCNYPAVRSLLFRSFPHPFLITTNCLTDFSDVVTHGIINQLQFAECLD